MDNNINEVNRKPRRTRGTPSHVSRNFFAIGVLTVSGICAYIFHNWSQAQKLKKSLAEGKFNLPETERERQLRMSLHGFGGTQEFVKNESQRKDKIL